MALPPANHNIPPGGQGGEDYNARFARMNINAQPFVPNVQAQPFVPMGPMHGYSGYPGYPMHGEFTLYQGSHNQNIYQ